jgi:hypothetical protein
MDQLVCSKVDTRPTTLHTPRSRALWCLFLPPWGDEKGHQENRTRDVCMPLSIDSKQLGNIIRGAHD